MQKKIRYFTAVLHFILVVCTILAMIAILIFPIMLSIACSGYWMLLYSGYAFIALLFLTGSSAEKEDE